MILSHRRATSAPGCGRCSLPAVSRIARAQAYPTRPVRIIPTMAKFSPG